MRKKASESGAREKNTRAPLEPYKPDEAEYGAWQAHPGAKTACRALETLVKHMTSCWPRRGRNLLELCCADGYFLEMFWHSGFDVTGQEHDAYLLSQARTRLKNAAEFTQARPESLPFDDRSFDYAVCLSGLESIDNPEELTKEIFRLATHGVLLAFPCSWSMHGMGRAFGRRQGEGTGQKFYSPLHISRLIRNLEESASGKNTWGGILPGPAWSWKHGIFSSLNFMTMPLPLGAIGMVRIDFTPPLGVSGLLVTSQPGLRRETASNSLGPVGKSGS